jgi:DNA-3-methyladenine glycosylase I
MSNTSDKQLVRCGWVKLNNPLYVEYHDSEWGKPLYEDVKLFELLCLEGQQAGVSWELVLNKREEYRNCFFNFDIDKCAQMSDSYIDSLLTNTGLIRNRLKLYSIRSNAQAAKAIISDTGSLNTYLWSFTKNKSIINSLSSYKEASTKTDISDKLSKDLKKRGFKFLGSTTCYAFMQAVGMVDDHENHCFCKTPGIVN